MDPFFKGKTINFYIGFGPGGTYDYYARLIARFIGRYIPGNPSVVAQAMARLTPLLKERLAALGVTAQI